MYDITIDGPFSDTIAQYGYIDVYSVNKKIENVCIHKLVRCELKIIDFFGREPKCMMQIKKETKNNEKKNTNMNRYIGCSE